MHSATQNIRQVESPLVRLVEEKKRWVAPDHSLGQGWRISGTRAIDGTRHSILGTPPIKLVCILVQNNQVHYEVIVMRDLIRASDAKLHVFGNDIITRNYNIKD
ncbi:hypothetical protein TNCV_635051 [Trichonephila clavipes]|nr:hypothetical protein TNCV_635051 [Trichonephila clavipes]